MGRGRIVLAMSGGVDSSVCAHLLTEAGYDVVGLFMRTGAAEPVSSSCELPIVGKTKGCCSASDARDAERIADKLGIPFFALNFGGEFSRIKDYFADEYLSGRTPNPCVVCNTWLKFGRLWEYAAAAGAGMIATGHYAKIVRGADGPELHRGDDKTKDQSYFLFGIAKEILGRIQFPVGGLSKQRVRELARDYGLAVHNKPDSQEVCFVPDGDYEGFLRRHRPDSFDAPGEVIDPGGAVVGTHRGIGRYTIGQRRGLGIAFGEPRYVIEIQPETNRLVVGPKESLHRATFVAERVNWLTTQAPTGSVRCQVKIRYLHEAADASVEMIDEVRVRVIFDAPQSAITPGQATVFYDGPRVLGGGWIAATTSKR